MSVEAETIERIKNNEAFRKLESHEAELEQITTMFWYVIKDYYAVKEHDLYTKANNYDRLYTYLFNIHTLLLNQDKELQDFVNNTYELDKSEKGANKDDYRERN